MDVGSPPRSDEAEISLFGPGFGECVVIHLGYGQWMIVDSCIRSQSGQPAALDYLAAIGADPATVVGVVASHWHDDHVRGLGAVLEASPNADFFFSWLLRKDEFRQLVESGRRSLIAESGTDSFAQVMDVLEERRSRTGRMPRRYAGPRQIVWERGNDQVRSLSPADAAVTEMLSRITERLPAARVTKRRVGDINPNHASVVLWLRVGQATALLGADLQRRRDPNLGWIAILDDPVKVPGLASVFKVPHHGSENAHESRVWTELLASEPIAILTPFARSGLPTEADLTRLCGLTPLVYTSSGVQPEERERPEPVQTMVDSVARYLRNAEPPTGQIRLRAPLATGVWTVELFPPASLACAA